MLITLFAPKWDKEVEMPGVPRAGETLVIDDKQWIVTDVEWLLDGGPVANLAIEPKPPTDYSPSEAARAALKEKLQELQSITLLEGENAEIADAVIAAYEAAKRAAE